MGSAKMSQLRPKAPVDQPSEPEKKIKFNAVVGTTLILTGVAPKADRLCRDGLVQTAKPPLEGVTYRCTEVIQLTRSNRKLRAEVNRHDHPLPELLQLVFPNVEKAAYVLSPVGLDEKYPIYVGESGDIIHHLIDNWSTSLYCSNRLTSN